MKFTDTTLTGVPQAAFLAVLVSFCNAGPTCFTCTDVANPSSCQALRICGNDEVCFTERKLSSDLQEKFTFGCEKTQVCEIGGKFSDAELVGRKRNVKFLPEVDRLKRDVTLCSRCCRSNNCNQEVCVGEVEESIPASQDVYVRLIGGINAYEGTVEVFHNGQWGSICDDNWTNTDAQVVCRMLGYSTVGAVGMAGGTYTQSTGRIWLDEVTCKGSESSLAQCQNNAWGVHDCQHSEDAAVLCSSVSTEDNIIFLLDTGLGGLLLRMNLMTQSFVPIPTLKVYNAMSFDYDPVDGHLYFVDTQLRQIVSVRYDGVDPREVRQVDVNAQLEKIEVDPLNRKLFYTDRGNDVIAVMNLDGSNYKIIVNSNLDEPRDIALDPRNQKIYWTDWGSSPKIERANYDGSERTVLVSSGLRWPNGIAIDYNENKIYFVDGGTHKIESMNLQGEGRTQIYGDDSSHFFAVAVFENYVYYTDWNKNTLMRVRKDGTGQTAVGPASFQRLSDIRIYSTSNNLPGVTAASPVEFDRNHVFVRLNSMRGVQTATSGFVEVFANGEWGTICDDEWDDRDAAVICRMLGFSESGAQATTGALSGHGNSLIVLDDMNCRGTEQHIVDCGITPESWGRHDCTHSEDAGVICTLDNTVNDFLLFTDSHTSLINRMDMETYSYVALELTGSSNPVGLAFNSADRRLYFSNVVSSPGSQIYSSALDATGQRLVKQMPSGSVIDGLAVDNHLEKLFYTDTGRDVIASCNLDGSNEVILVRGNLDEPRAIVLDTQDRIMYWTDWGASPKIEKAHYDGTGRQVIVSTNLKWPNGLVLDKSSGLLYFCDAGTHAIESVDTSGQHRNLLFSDLSAHFFGLALSQQHLYYSDWNRPSVMRLNKDGSGQTPVGPDSFGRIDAIVASES